VKVGIKTKRKKCRRNRDYLLGVLPCESPLRNEPSSLLSYPSLPLPSLPAFVNVPKRPLERVLVRRGELQKKQCHAA
jgi:hypothetical protein